MTNYICNAPATVVLTLASEGTLVIEDENGNKATLQQGDTFFVHRGSDITFSTPKFAVAYKVAARTSMGH